MTVKKAKKIKVARNRGGGKYTESMFWGMIRSTLRQKSRFWPPIKEAKEAARRPYKGTNKKIKWEYQCSHCKNWFFEKEIEIDHIVEAGTLRSGKDLEGFVERLFCEKHGLQVLCKSCHKIKTQNAKNSLRNLSD